ncbi:hypothetical protein LX32DRAFT_706260 [Colletotrichum zoysiae]|uniref:Uncharacterized protein n=1 Tax=Colletotrichum zoysiae TaxID=1216348 RepID=A0AAD9H9W5_9PEZI|nr:hypothetical protein LX32DRAFT_706260 [Colletotrichum zoysiae]
MILVPHEPSQVQQMSGEREETGTNDSLDMDSSEAQFTHSPQHHQDLRSDLKGEDYLNLGIMIDRVVFHPLPQNTTFQHLQEQFLQLQTRLDEYDEKICKLQTGIDRIGIEVARVGTEVAHDKATVEADERQRADMQQIYQRDVSNLEAKIDMLNGQIRGLKAQAARRQVVKSQDKAIANSRKVSDDTIKSSWRTMAYNIESLVANILTGRPSRYDLEHHKHKDEEEACAFCHLDAREILFLQYDDLRESVVEKLVWDAVTRHIFPFQGVHFGRRRIGAPSHLLSALFNQLLEVPELKNNPAMLFRWKAESAVMIDGAIGVDNEKLDTAVDEEYHGLCAFIPLDCPDVTTARQSLHRELRNIFKQAAEIHRVLMQSRAHFYLDRVGTEGEVHYNPEYHEAEVYDQELSEKSIVLLGISPSLVKVGNADGGNYDKSTRLVKASVICD